MTQFARVLDFDSGVAMIVTDLHGEGHAYDQIKSTFLELRREGKADRLILCGDLIHGYRESYNDDSLRMMLDVMRMQKDFGSDTVTMLMGNHEMPHVYNITLEKGHHEFTARFEESLSQSGKRDEVLAFLKHLPIYARTKAGVLISHARRDSCCDEC
ncbi:MAG: metallophosphoesterase [Anaerolineae bacterium]|nr:metallophosphoesterase [Anaerolineae bacterium]